MKSGLSVFPGSCSGVVSENPLADRGHGICPVSSPERSAVLALALDPLWRRGLIAFSRVWLSGCPRPFVEETVPPPLNRPRLKPVAIALGLTSGGPCPWSLDPGPGQRPAAFVQAPGDVPLVI